jgi:hypothetical protein
MQPSGRTITFSGLMPCTIPAPCAVAAHNQLTAHMVDAVGVTIRLWRNVRPSTSSSTMKLAAAVWRPRGW